MAPLRSQPLATRIALVVCTVVAAGLACRVELTWRADQALRQDEELAHARRTAERLAEAVDAGALHAGTERVVHALAAGGGEIEALHLVDRRGTITWSTQHDQVGRSLPVPPVGDSGNRDSGWVGRVRSEGTWAGFVDEGGQLVAVAALERTPAAAGTGVAERVGPPIPGPGAPRVLYVSWDRSAAVAERSLRHVRSHLSGLLFALLLGFVLWWAMRRLVSRPIEELARIAARHDQIATDFAGPGARVDEIGALARAMAEARRRLDDARRDAAERAARLSGAIDATADGIVLATARDGRWLIDHVNARFVALCGRPAAALEGRTVEEGLASFADRLVEGERVAAWVAQALAQPEFEGQRPGALRGVPGEEGGADETRLLDVITRPVRDEAGVPFGRLWLVRDVTRERTHERRLKRQNQELAALDLVGRRVSRSLDRRAILAAALETLREVTDAAYGAVLTPGDAAAASLDAALAAHRAALAGGEVVAVPSVAAAPGLAAAVPEGIDSLVALPLRHTAGLDAVLVLGRAEAAAFGDDEIALLRRVVHLVDVALENARLFARTEEQLIENQTLTEVGRSIGRGDGLEAVLEDILRVIHHRLTYRNAAILLPDEGGHVLYVRASVGYHTNLTALRLPVDGGSVTARAYRGGELINVPDVRTEPGYVAGSDDIRSELALPLLFGGRVLGILDVESDRLGAFGPDDERLLVSVASQAAMVLQNARLLVETRARATRFEAVNEIARAVASTLDARWLDRAIVSQLARVVPCERYAMLHYDHERGRVSRTVVLDARAQLAHDGDGLEWDFVEGLNPDTLVPHRAEWLPDTAVVAEQAEVRHVAQGLASLVLVPIALDGVVAAAIVAAAAEVDGFTSEQIRLLETVSYHVGVALKNAQLFARLQESYTQLDEAQDGLVRSEKLRALGEMASGVAHDFNNVLGAILGRAQLLKQAVGPGDVAAELEIIEKAAQDGAATVRRLQDFTRVRTDHGFASVSLTQIVEDCLSLTRGRWRDEAERAGVHYDVQSVLEPVPPVAGEASELREVLTNMILNALDAMPDGGTLHLATSHDATAGQVRLEVRDDGEGMSEEVRARIFDPFFTTKGVRGVGLGLSVVYGIVQRHGGRIDVTSTPGHGTTMSVIFPVDARGEDAAGDAAGAGRGAIPVPWAMARTAPAGPSLRILVVDDEPGVRSLLADLLRAVGHVVVEMPSGRDALAALAAAAGDGCAFDLVLTDLGMPDMSGWEVARAVRERADAPPVVLVTGWGIQLDDQMLADSGVCDVIAKPFTIEEVVAAVGRAVERRAA